MLNLLFVSLVAFIPATSFATDCKSSPPAVIDVKAESSYSDAHSIVDAKLKKAHDLAVKPLEDYMLEIAKMSDTYLADPTKNLDQGQCTNTWLKAWAIEGAMLGEMKTKHAYHERTLMVTGIGLVYAKTKKLANKDDATAIEAWLKKLGDLTLAHAEQNKTDKTNISYWDGLALAVVGELINDKKYLTWSTKAFESAMAQVQDDGSLPLEIQKGKRALNYHNYATAPLVLQASILNLYSPQLKELVQFTFRALLNPKTIEKKTGEKQEAVTPMNLAWLAVYLRRDQDAEMALFLKSKHPLFYSKLGGDLTLQNPLETAAKSQAGVLSDTDFNPKTKNPAFTSTKHPRICFDQAHFNLAIGDGRYSAIFGLLESDGYKIQYLTTPLTPKLSESCDILYISAAQSSHGTESVFTNDEITVVHDWVQKGGALLLMTDHPPLMAKASEKLANAFGVDGSGGTTEDSAHALNGDQDPTNIVFTEKEMNQNSSVVRGRSNGEHLHKVIAFTGQSLKGPSDCENILVLSSTAIDRFKKETEPAAGRALMLSLKVGKGRVIITGDASLFTSKVDLVTNEKFGINRAGIDNVQLALNTFHWLSGLLDQKPQH